MNRALNFNKSFIVIGIPAFLISVIILISKSALIATDEYVNLAITIDLLLTVPIIYFFLIRKTAIPNTTVIPVFVIGIFVGSYFLPKESQTYLSLFKTWVLPLVELSILTVVIIKVRKAIKSANFKQANNADFLDRLKSVCYEILPNKLVLPFTTEVGVLYYGFIAWKNRPLQKNEYSYHKNSGTPALFGAFIILIVIETFALHFLLARWNGYIAWILTGLSTYTTIQLLGFAKSLSMRPIAINENRLNLRYGILNEVEIPFTDILNIERSGRVLEKDAFTKTLSPLGEMESHNIIIHVVNDLELIGIYGWRKKFRVLALYIDQPDEFMENMDLALQQTAK